MEVKRISAEPYENEGANTTCVRGDENLMLEHLAEKHL